LTDKCKWLTYLFQNKLRFSEHYANIKKKINTKKYILNLLSHILTVPKIICREIGEREGREKES